MATNEAMNAKKMISESKYFQGQGMRWKQGNICSTALTTKMADKMVARILNGHKWSNV
jgi:hypothetical protein